MTDNTPLPPMPEPPDLSDVPSWDRTDVARQYYRERSIALEARLRLAQSALGALGVIGGGYCFCSTHRDPEKEAHEPECRDARKALAAIGEIPEEKP